MRRNLLVVVLMVVSLLVTACGGASTPQNAVGTGADTSEPEAVGVETTIVVEGQSDVVVETQTEALATAELMEQPAAEATEAPVEEAEEEAMQEPTEEAAEGEGAAGAVEEPMEEEADAGPLAEAPLPPPAATQVPALPIPTMAPLPYNEFEIAAVNPFVETRADNLSTFALDVDTASYAVARRYVTEGALPPPDAVRVEEFVNYFEQDYALPSNTAFGIYADSAPSPFHFDGTHILRVGIKGYDVPADQRPATALTFVIDVSGSMAQENRLGLVKRSLQMLVQQMRPEDTMAIVIYGTEAGVLVPPTSGAEKDQILSALYSLEPSGSTNAEAGLMLGYQQANQSYVPNGINRVILCSDGVANVGTTDPETLAQTLRSYADAGITLTTIGFGMGDYNDVLMEQLADQGDGNYGYVDTLEEAERFLVTEASSTLQTIALDAKVQVDFNPETVARYRLMGYENRAVADEDFRNNAVDAGEIGAGHTVTALYAVQFVPGTTGRVATVQLRWEDPTTREVREIAGEVQTSDVASSFDAASLRYQLDVVVAHYAELLRRSPYAQYVSLADLRVRSERLAAQLNDPDVSEFAALVARASQMQ